jgi:hypothetical protein
LDVHIDDPNAHDIVPTVEALVENLSFDGVGDPPLPVQTLGEAVSALVGAVAAEPPYIGQWKPSTGFSGIPDWGILKLDDADLVSRNLLASTNDPGDIYPYYYRAPSPARDLEFLIPGNDPATDPLWNSEVPGGLLPGTGAGEAYSGGFTRDGTSPDQPVMRTARVMGQPTTSRQAVTVSGSFYPADRGVLALVHWPPGGSLDDFLTQPLLDRCIAATLCGQGVTNLPVGGSIGDPCIRVDSIGAPSVAPLVDGDAGGIFAPGTDEDDEYDPFAFPGYSSGQYDLREIVTGFADDGSPLRPPWNDWDQDAANGARRYFGTFVPGPGQVRLGTVPAANDPGDHAPVQPYGIPVLGGGALLYDPVPATFVDGFRVLEGVGGIANTIIWENSEEDQDKNFFGYRLPVLQDYTAETGLKWTPRGEDANTTKETFRFLQPKEPNSGSGLVDGFLPTAGNYANFDEDFWGWQVARYRHSFLLPEAVGGHPPSTDDFRTQHIETSIPNGTEKILTAGLDYDLIDPDRAIILISGVTQQAGGPGNTFPLPPADVTVQAMPNDDGTQIVISRLGASGSTTVNLLILEYRGPPGGENEFLVRSRDLRVAGDATVWSPEEPFVDLTKVAVFSGGAMNNGGNPAPTDWHAHLALAFVRVDGDLEAEYALSVPALSEFVWQAVEFTGSAWNVLSGPTARLPPGVFPVPASYPLGGAGPFDPTHTWIYGMLKSDTAGASFDQGFRAYLNGAGTVINVEVPQSAVGKTVHVTFLENPYLTVQQFVRNNQWNGLFTAQLLDGADFVGVPDIGRAWPWTHGFAQTGGASQMLPVLWQYTLTDGDTVDFKREQSGEFFSYHFQLMSFNGTKATLPAGKTEVGTYHMLHFKREADFEAFVRDGVAPNHPVDGYEMYGVYLLDPAVPSNPEEDENIVNTETSLNAFSPFGPAPDYGYAAMPYHPLRSTVVIDSTWMVDPSNTPGGIDTAEWSWISESSGGDPHVMWVSGVRYLLPRRTDDGTKSLEVDLSVTGSDFWYTYRTEDNDLTGDPQTSPAAISSPAPMFIGIAPFSFELDPILGPTYDPQGLTNTFGTRRQRMEFPYRLMGSNGSGNFGESNGPQEADAITVSTGANDLLLLGDLVDPAFSENALPRVFTRRPLAHRDADGSALPFTFADGHGVPFVDVGTGGGPKKLLYHSTRFSDGDIRGAFGNFQDPAELPKGYSEFFTYEKDGRERFLDETYRYAGQSFRLVSDALPGNLTDEQADQLDGPGMQSWTGGLTPIPVRAGRTSATHWALASWLQSGVYQIDLVTASGAQVAGLQVAGLPDRNPPLSDGARYPFPSAGLLMYPQIDYSDGYRPSLVDGDIPSVQPDYSVIPGHEVLGVSREHTRVFDAAWSRSGNPADVSGQPFLTFRIDGLTLDDFKYRPSGSGTPGGMSLTGIAIMVKVPGLTTRMDLGRRDGAGPSKQDALLDGAGCQVVGSETFDGVDPETGVVYSQVKVNVGPYANLTKVVTNPPAENDGEVPVMVQVRMTDTATDYTFDRQALSPGEFEAFDGAGVSASKVRGIVGIRVVRTDGETTVAP